MATVRGPADVAAMVPYLFGFQPAESLVLIAIEGPRKRFGPVLRVDLVDEPILVQEQTSQIVSILTGNGVARVLLAAFSESAMRAGPLVDRLLVSLAASGIAVEDAFRADGRRWWPYLCDDPLCCSPTGAPYDVTTSAASAEAVLAGLTFAADRDALRSVIAPADALTRRQVDREVRRLRSDGATGEPAARELCGWLARQLAEPGAVSAADLAWLALAVQSHQGRDTAIALITRANAPTYFELWRRVMRAVSDELLPDVGCVAAFAAWLEGRGAVASHVVERVLAVQPDNPLAAVVVELLAQGINPRLWESLGPFGDDVDDVDSIGVDGNVEDGDDVPPSPLAS